MYPRSNGSMSVGVLSSKQTVSEAAKLKYMQILWFIFVICHIVTPTCLDICFMYCCENKNTNKADYPVVNKRTNTCNPHSRIHCKYTRIRNDNLQYATLIFVLIPGNICLCESLKRAMSDYTNKRKYAYNLPLIIVSGNYLFTFVGNLVYDMKALGYLMLIFFFQSAIIPIDHTQRWTLSIHL